MNLWVQVLQARNLRASSPSGSCDPYVRLKLGKQKYRTNVIKKNLNPTWGEEFSFQTDDLNEKLVINVMDENKFNDFMGQIKVPLAKVFEREDKSMGTAWYAFQSKSKKAKSGEVLLTILFSESYPFVDETQSYDGDYAAQMEFSSESPWTSPLRSYMNSPIRSPYASQTEFSNESSLNSSLRSFMNSPVRTPYAPQMEFSSESSLNSPMRPPLVGGTGLVSPKENKSYAPIFTARLAQAAVENKELTSHNVRGLALPDLPETPRFEIYESSFYEKKLENHPPDCTFDEAVKIMESTDQGDEVPNNLPGGILLDQSYMVAPSDLNSLLFSPDSEFMRLLADVKGNTEWKQEPWRLENDGKSFTRVVTYMKAATKMTKVVKATEEQTYLKADGRVFAVLVSVSTPDVMSGNSFKPEILYCITPGPELSSGEKSSRVIISWRINFLQSIMMQGMIERRAGQGLKDSFEQFANLLSLNVNPVEMKDLLSDKNAHPTDPKIHPSDIKTHPSDQKIHLSDKKTHPSDNFDEAMKTMERNDQGAEVPNNLPGVLLDQSYMVAPPELNSILFSPDSEFTKSLADMRGNTEWKQEPWRSESDGKSLRRVVTYMKAATKMTKVAKATEEQTYLKADGKVFAVLISVSTPDVMYGNTFKIEMLYCITPGPELLSGEKSSRLIISWRMNFLQSTMMKGMIERGAGKALTIGFEQFANFLCQKVEPVDLKDLVSDKKSHPTDQKIHPSDKKTHPSDQKIYISDKKTHPSDNFDEAMKTMERNDQGAEVLNNLPGVLLDQSYMVAPPKLNSILFSPDSEFTKSLADMRGNTEWKQEPWRLESDGKSLRRVVTYMKAATKMTKVAKATEEQTYLKADGKVFAVLISVSTPDVMYGNTFKIEMLYRITPGPELPSGEKSSRLIISWRMNFLQSTMMKGMIERGAGKALMISFEQFANFLCQKVEPVDLKDLGSNKEQVLDKEQVLGNKQVLGNEQVLASMQVERQPDWKLMIQHILKFPVVVTVFMGLYLLMHILLVSTNMFQGLEFAGIDLPDSIGEIIVCAVLVLQGKQALEIITRFTQTREQIAGDHGVKAQGDGWLLTIALIEGNSLATVDSTGFSDPYVVFTCNGKTKTSSIKFQKLDPQWNEIFEFDAMDELPSVLDVEVFDFDGPFSQATSLGHAEINFVKSDISALADTWIPLNGKLTQACQSKLHLRILLNNTRGSNAVKEYLTKVEKEVGKKLNVRSPQTNTAFQKIFGLPAEEFLINDFTCQLKRKMLLQGRVFLSVRIIGFHANLFGSRTTFFFLWEDIEDIHVLPPTLASMGSPSIIILLRKGRGMDAKHGAKTQDEDGRLKFHFHTFVSFNVAHRTIMALWKARSLSPEQKVRIVEEESERKDIQTEDNSSILDSEDASMSEIYSSVLHVPMSFFMEMFGGGDLDCKVMEKVGCMNYSHDPWELVKPDVYQRQIRYKFDKRVSRYSGEVSSTQQRSPFIDRNGCVVEEFMILHGVPQGDHYNIHIRYQVENLSSSSHACNLQVFFGITWLKSTKNQKKLTTNIVSNLVDRLKSVFSQVEKEFTAGK